MLNLWNGEVDKKNDNGKRKHLSNYYEFYEEING